MKVLRNFREVNDFVNENLKQSTIRQRIVSAIKRGTLFPGAKPNPGRWKPIGSVRKTKRSTMGKTKRVTVAQRIERQPHLRKHLDPKGILKSKSILTKYYLHRRQNNLPAHEESPSESVFKNISVNRKGKNHITRFYQEVPKTVTFMDYWEIYKDEILKKVKEYPVSKVGCVLRINMQRIIPTAVGSMEVHPFESKTFIITEGMDMDEFFSTLRKQMLKSAETFLKNGSGSTIFSLDSFVIDVYEYKPFAGSSYIKFWDIKVEFKGKEITLDTIQYKYKIY